jgi:glutaredoxin-like protein DUF836
VTREVVLYTRTNCGLCVEAAADLRRLQDDLAFKLIERDIDTDPALLALYDEQVPVIAVAGRTIAHAPIDASSLRTELARALA